MYDKFADDYDRFVNWPERLAFELPLIESLLKELSGPAPLRILDAACGTGRHATALAARGYRVSGADLSAPMIAKARANAGAAGADVNFETAGFGELSQKFSPQQFDAVLCLGNSLPHLLSAAALTAALQDFAACLRPGGLLLIQNRNFDAVMQQHQRWMEPQAFSEGQNEWLFQRFYDFETSGLIRFNVVTLKRQVGSDWTPISTASTFLAPQLHAQLRSALTAEHFTEIRAFGSLSGEAFQAEKSGNLVLCCRFGLPQ
jgi:2-polyprenyl-3-methyl-5-hydroxy-6-metoxy-1,4-benzoquinol methylase